MGARKETVMPQRAMRNQKFFICLALAIGPGLSGCAGRRAYRISSPYPATLTIAIAPVLNFSGASDIDTLNVTDILYSELQQVQGITVVPVNRVLAQLAQDRIDDVQTPHQAVNLAKRVDADMIMVSAITEYDPYYPPIVGIASQIFTVTNDPPVHSAVDPIALQRLASPLRITVDDKRGHLPTSQLSRIYNSRDRRIVDEVKQFASSRGTGTSPYKWQLYLRSQTHYLRFVCHQGIRELFEKEAARIEQDRLSDSREYH